MTTVLNTTGQTMQLEWCIVPVHWFEGLHGTGGGWVQSDLADPESFEASLPDILVSVSIPPDSLLTYDETQPNGAAIEGDVSAVGMQEIP